MRYFQDMKRKNNPVLYSQCLSDAKIRSNKLKIESFDLLDRHFLHFQHEHQLLSYRRPGQELMNNRKSPEINKSFLFLMQKTTHLPKSSHSQTSFIFG